MNSKNKKIIGIIGSIAIGIMLGGLLFNNSGETMNSPTEVSQTPEHDTIWTCSMHPEIEQHEPGKCPLCGMDLIPKKETKTNAHKAIVELSDYAKELTQLQTVVIGGSAKKSSIELYGKVKVDESRSYTQSAHIEGRIENLYVNVTGVNVHKGQALAAIYSPGMRVAQEELLQAYSSRKTNPILFEAVKTKFHHRNINTQQIKTILEGGEPIPNFNINADIEGVVVKKLVERGDYVQRGTPMYEIANLKKVWVTFDVYEKEMKWVDEGDKINFSVASLPGENFEGKVTFISPTLDPATRTAEARVEVNNVSGQLKPGMFVTGVVRSATQQENSETVTVPKTAVLWTGKRSVVYVALPEGSGYQLREVVLGASIGEVYIVEKGLKFGEEVVVNGAFTVDAAAQLAGKPSMINR